ncbi:hypothetical protein RO3G_16596 [Lichtheimia corymbifera JMRC:FSU:9682]|uniref:DM2 domain-containing protein n=1 Tax=Lichtheimia corymbifera JMRC:FSU:9682 TaxID=1263082 RepID=A0A068SH68_9FUNG|nr:hypothetical protein RO3G_16596 [Lichtheimia corymbifera JMRC:FSU:9682]
MDCRNYNSNLEEFNSLGIKPDSAAAAASVYHSTNKPMDPINYYRATNQDPRTLLSGPHQQEQPPMIPPSPATPVTAPNAAAAAGDNPAANFLDHSLATGFGAYNQHHPSPFSPHQFDSYTTTSHTSTAMSPFQDHRHHRQDIVDYASSSQSFHTPPIMPYSHHHHHPHHQQQTASSLYHPSPGGYNTFNATSFDLDQKKRKMMDLSMEVPTTMKKKSRSRKKRPKEPEDPNAPPKPKRRTGLDKPLILSAALSAFVGGDAEMSRPEIVKVLWKYIKDNNLQDPADRRYILCDEKLKTIFDQDRINSFGMNRDLSAHLTKKTITSTSPAPATTTTTTTELSTSPTTSEPPSASTTCSVQTSSTPPSHSNNNPLYME